MLITNRTQIPQSEKEYQLFIQNFQIFKDYASFVKYHFLDMKEKMQVELGVPVKDGLNSKEKSKIYGGLHHIYHNTQFRFKSQKAMTAKRLLPNEGADLAKRMLLAKKSILDRAN